MKLGTHVHHDVKCKLWKNKITVTYISRLDELGNFDALPQIYPCVEAIVL